MYSFEDYEFIAAEINKRFSELSEQLGISEVLETYSESYEENSDEYVPIVVDLPDGRQVRLNHKTCVDSYHVHKDGDPTQYIAWQFDPSDSHFIAIEGSYDSWNGGDWESDEVFVAEKKYTQAYYYGKAKA